MMYYRTPNPSEVDHAADVLEMSPQERADLHAFYNRERPQNRAANVKKLKQWAEIAVQAIVLFALSYAIWAVWTERLPK